MTQGRDRGLQYPPPRPPMIGDYLVRKRHVAAGLAAIDVLCGVFPARTCRAPGQQATEAVKSILVSQCGHLGDLIMTLPMLRWVRVFRPQTRIGLIVGSWATPMLAGISDLYDTCYFADHFMLDRSGKPLMERVVRHRQSWKRTIAEVRTHNFDAAIDCYAFLQNNIPLLHACNIPIRVGFTSGGFGPLLTHKVRWEHRSRSLIDYPRDLLRALFNDVSLDRPLRAYYPAPIRPNRHHGQAYVVVQTGTGNPIKEWPDEHWIELARMLRTAGLQVVLAGAGARERDRTARLEATVPGLVNLCDRLSWDEFVALVAEANHVVCLDSSTSHLAAAFCIPSTVIMSGTSDQGQFGPANDEARILTFSTPCAPCFRSNGCEHMACVRNVGVAEVAETVLKSVAAAKRQVANSAQT
jgi:ADP-heptose:LPS heptosyltransferase